MLTETIKVRCPVVPGNSAGYMVINVADVTDDHELYEDRTAELSQAIASLDPEDTSSWTTDGKPQTDALSDRVSGKRVTAAERDEAWAQMNAQ